MFSGHHLMQKTPGSKVITWPWKQTLVGVSRTVGISWTLMTIWIYLIIMFNEMSNASSAWSIDTITLNRKYFLNGMFTTPPPAPCWENNGSICQLLWCKLLCLKTKFQPPSLFNNKATLKLGIFTLAFPQGKASHSVSESVRLWSPYPIPCNNQTRPT